MFDARRVKKFTPPYRFVTFFPGKTAVVTNATIADSLQQIR